MSRTSTGTTRPRLRRLLRIVTGIGIEDREAEEAEGVDGVVADGAADTTAAAVAATAEAGTKGRVAVSAQLPVAGCHPSHIGKKRPARKSGPIYAGRRIERGKV
jgi:hypothetical protein